MSIKIKTRKIVSSDGTKGRVIRELSALPKEKLPNLYLDDDPQSSFAFWYSDFRNAFITENKKFCDGSLVNTILEVGKWYSESDFKERLDFIYESGNVLKKINDFLRMLQHKWKGNETFFI